MADDFTIEASDFKKLYSQLSKIDPEIKKVMRKKMMDAAKPIVEEVKRAELAIPAKGGEAQSARKKKGSNLGLRQSLANATIADFRGTGKGAAVHIRVSTTRFVAASGRHRTIPYHIEGRRKKPWRHPVFGNRNNWVTQAPHPFLAVTVKKYRDEFKTVVTNVVTEALSNIK